MSKVTDLTKQLSEILEDDIDILEYDAESLPNGITVEYLMDMVRDFDNYESLHEEKEELNEVLKICCGVELNASTATLIKGYNNLPKYPSPDDLDNKIQWLINCLNIVALQDMVGLKVSNAGTIEYSLSGKNYIKNFIVHVGNCLPNTTQLIPHAEDKCGICHMKYGANKHWNLSCNALIEIPNEFTQPILVAQSRKKNKKYNYVFYSPNGFTYAFGVPRTKHDETILISCY